MPDHTPDDLQGALNVQRRLAARLNERPVVLYSLRVLKSARMDPATPPEGYDTRTWRPLVQTLVDDPATAIVSGVFYLAGDLIQVTQAEALALLIVLPEFFAPEDAHTDALRRTIEEG